MHLPTQTIRSKRRTMALQVKPDGSIIVRAPRWVSESAVHRFIRQNQEWIETTVRRILDKAKRNPPQIISEEEMTAHREKALAVLTERCRFYAEAMGVTFKSLGLSDARSRWGSCSPSGRLRFNWRLGLAPLEVLDYVVVHELAHLRELNHSRRFWAIVAEAFPGYSASKKWLREHPLPV